MLASPKQHVVILCYAVRCQQLPHISMILIPGSMPPFVPAGSCRDSPEAVLRIIELMQQMVSNLSVPLNHCFEAEVRE